MGGQSSILTQVALAAFKYNNSVTEPVLRNVRSKYRARSSNVVWKVSSKRAKLSNAVQGNTYHAVEDGQGWEHKQLDFVMQLCKKQNVHVRHEYAPIIPKCGIMLLLRNVPWRRP